jgi:hypothetical protein
VPIDGIQAAADLLANLLHVARGFDAFAHGFHFARELQVQGFAAGLRLAVALVLIGDELTDFIELADHVA